MKKFIKENWFKLSIILIIVITISGLFYWKEYRPSQIKAECDNIAKDKAIQNNEEKNGKFTMKSYDGYYKFCLNQKGL